MTRTITAPGSVMSVTVIWGREYRLDPNDPTIVQTRMSGDWRPYAVCLSTDDAFHVVTCARLREARAV